MDVTNRFLQSDVDYLIQEQVGAVAKSIKTLVHDIDKAIANAVAFKYGDPVFLGPNDGMIPASATGTLALLKGFVPYINSGVIDDQGYAKPKYTNIPVVSNGVMYLACTGTLLRSAKCGIGIDPTSPSYKKVVDITLGTPSDVLDVSSVVSVENPSNSKVVLVNVKIS